MRPPAPWIYTQVCSPTDSRIGTEVGAVVTLHSDRAIDRLELLLRLPRAVDVAEGSQAHALRRQAIHDFAVAVGALAGRTLRGVNRLAHSLARHARLRSRHPAHG